jgi:hypothetical protein
MEYYLYIESVGYDTKFGLGNPTTMAVDLFTLPKFSHKTTLSPYMMSLFNFTTIGCCFLGARLS